jgi:curved DNA-binding protein CbpA
MGQTGSRQYSYQQYYNAMQKNGKINLNGIDLNTLDPYEVLNVNKNFTWDELKDAYRRTALLTHPDKEGGDERIFNIVTKCFEYLAKEYKKRDADKPHHMLKEQSKNFFLDQKNSLPHPSEIYSNGADTKEPFEKRFNDTFNKCRIENEDMDFGYGDFMDKSSKSREDFSINNIFNGNKVDASSFNEAFKRNVAPSKEIIKYREPEPLQLAKSIQYTELGGKRPDDYSSSLEQQSKNGLTYTDYMKAYTNTRLVDEDMIKSKKEFKSVEEYENYRDKRIKKKLSPKELQMQEIKRIEAEKEEQDRLSRLRIYDENISMMHDKATRLLK